MQREVAPATFHLTNERPVQASQVRQAFLSQAPFLSATAHAPAELSLVVNLLVHGASSAAGRALHKRDRRRQGEKDVSIRSD